MAFKLNWKIQSLAFMLSAVFFAVLYRVVREGLIGLFIAGVQVFYTGHFVIDYYIYTAILFIPIVIVHESIHGAVFTVFGGKVRFGFKHFCFYTRDVSEKPVSRVKFLIVLLAPVTLMSLFSLIVGGWLGGLVYFFSLIGSTGDIIMAINLCKYTYDSKVIDRIYGYDVV